MVNKRRKWMMILDETRMRNEGENTPETGLIKKTDEIASKTETNQDMKVLSLLLLTKEARKRKKLSNWWKETGQARWQTEPLHLWKRSERAIHKARNVHKVLQCSQHERQAELTLMRTMKRHCLTK